MNNTKCHKMIWLLTVVSQIIFGSIAGLFIAPIDSDIVIVAGFGIPVGISVSTFIYFISSMFFGQNLFNLFVNAGILGALTFILFFALQRNRITNLIRRTKMSSIIYAMVYFIIPFFTFAMIYFPVNNKLPNRIRTKLHEDATILASFENGCNSGFINPFSLKNPLYFGLKLTEKWLPGFHSAMLLSGYATTSISLFVPSSLLFFSFAIIMKYLGLRLKIPELALITAPIVAYSLAGYEFFDFESRANLKKESVDFVEITPSSTTNYLHPHLHILVSSRSALYVSTFTLLMTTVLLSKVSKISQCAFFICGGFVLSSTYQACYFMFLLILVLIFIRNPKNFPVVPFLFYLAGAAVNISRISVHSYSKPLWILDVIAGKTFSSVTFWYRTLGVFVPFAVAGVLMLHKNETKIGVAYVIVFILSINRTFYEEIRANFSPYYAFFMPFGYMLFLVFFHRFSLNFSEEESRGIVDAIGSVIVFIGCCSAFGGTHKMMKSMETVYTSDDFKLGKWIIKNTKTSDVILTPNELFDPVSTIAGRQTVRSDIEGLKFFGTKGIYVNETKSFMECNNTGQFIDVVVVKKSDPARNACNFPDESQWTEAFFTNDVIVYNRIKKSA